MSAAESLPTLTKHAVVLAGRAAPHLLAAHLGLALLAGLVPVAGAWLLKLVLDSLAAGEAFTTLGWLAAGLGLVALTSAVTMRADEYVRAELGRAIERTSQAELYDAATARSGSLGSRTRRTAIGSNWPSTPARPLPGRWSRPRRAW